MGCESSNAELKASGERVVNIRMTKSVSGERLRMDNEFLRYRFVYQGSLSVLAALRAAASVIDGG